MVKYNLCQNSTTRRSIQCIKMNQRNKKEVQKVATSTEQDPEPTTEESRQCSLDYPNWQSCKEIIYR